MCLTFQISMILRTEWMPDEALGVVNNRRQVFNLSSSTAFIEIMAMIELHAPL